MKKGPSLYYASDKNIYDALNQSKVDSETIQGMFRRRNIVCSKLTKREDLAQFFSRLTHDLIDHQDLSEKLGIVPRRERITAVDLLGNAPGDVAIQHAVEQLKAKLTKQGDVVQVHIDGATTTLVIKYSVIDYKKSEFSQLQHRNGFIEMIQENGRLVVRSTKSDYMDDIRDELIREIEAETDHELTRDEISLYHHTTPLVRSKFFYDLISELPGYSRRDVTEVFVYKPRPIKSEDSTDENEGDPHIEKIFLRGVGVSRSELLKDLTQEKSYYIAKIGWLSVERMGTGASYELEATFADPKECTGFSYILKGVYDLAEDGKMATKKRTPNREEIDRMARLIEVRARELINQLDAGGIGNGST